MTHATANSSLPRRLRLVIAANAEPDLGGQGRNLTQMVTGLGRDFDLAVFSRATTPGVAGKGVPMPTGARLLAAVPVARRLRDWQVWLDDTHFDRVVASRLPASDLFQGATGQCLGAQRVARSRGTPVVLDAVTAHVDDLGAVMDSECRRLAVRPPLHRRHRERMRREYAQADLIRVMSERARRTFLDHGVPDDRLVVVPPALDLAEFPPPRPQAPDGVFRIAYVGLLEPWKGFQYLVEAFEALHVPRAELALWGATGARPIARYLRDAVARGARIRIQSFDPRREGYAKPYLTASVVVHPSLSDGFGQVVAEAMACGVPVVATDRTGAADWIEDGRNGFVIPAADAGAIRERLEELASSRAAAADLGRRARETMRALSPDEFRRRYCPRLMALA